MRTPQISSVLILLSLCFHLVLWMPTARAAEQPTLSFPDDWQTHAQSRVDLPLNFAGHGNAINAATFAVVYDAQLLQPVSASSATFHLPESFSRRAWQPDESPGQINVSLYTFARTAIPDGRLATFAFTAACPPEVDPATVLTTTVSFAREPATSFGNLNGADVPGSGIAGTVSIDCTPIPPNQAPTAADDGVTLAEDESVIVDVLANDLDPDSNQLSLQSVNDAAHGVTAIQGKKIHYAPDPDYNGPDFFAYTIVDGDGATATALVRLTVTPVNDPPTAADDEIRLDEDETSLVAVLANDADVDGDPLTVSLDRGPRRGAARVDIQGRIVYTPDTDYHGADSFTYQISDGHGGQASAQVDLDILSINDLPRAEADKATTQEDRSISVDVLANDSDVDGDRLRIVEIGTPEEGSVLLRGGKLRYQPPADYSGPDHFTYTISDGQGGQDTTTVTLTVLAENDPPFAGDDQASTQEETPAQVELTENDGDPDGDPLQLTLISPARHGHATLTSGGILIYTPTLNFTGVDTLDYQVLDPGGLGATARVQIQVDGINDPPQAGDDAALTQQGVPIPVDVLANDVDVDGDGLVIESVGPPLHGRAVIQTAERILYTPAAGAIGLDHFVYTASDSAGALAWATVSIVVEGDGGGTVQAVDDRATAFEDQPLLIDVLANDEAPEPNLVLLAVGAAGHGSTALENDRIRYSPAPDFYGDDSFVYTVGDGADAADLGRVYISVRAINDPPRAANDTIQASPGTWASVDVLFNDHDPENDTLVIQGFDQGRLGTVRLASPGSGGERLRYRPRTGTSGSDSFSYWIADGKGGTATARVRVEISAVNEAPVAVDDDLATDEDGPLSIHPLANDSDAEGDPLSLLTWSEPLHGSLVLSGTDSLFYTPRPDFNGQDGFVYTLVAGNDTEDPGAQASASVTIHVAPVADEPEPVGDAALTEKDTPVTVEALANDKGDEGQSLTIVDYTQPDHGTTSLNPDGDFDYTPESGFAGTDTFSYTLGAETDGGERRTAGAPGRQGAVTVIVAPEPGRVQAMADTLVVDEDSPGVLDVLANDQGGPGLLIVGLEQPHQGRVSLTNGGLVRYTPRANVAGNDIFTYTVSDGGSGADRGVAQVTIQPINDPPVPRADLITTGEDEPVTIHPLANDGDAEGGTLALSTVGAAHFGTVEIVDEVTIRYTPGTDFSGEDRFLYQIADPQGATALGIVRIAVSATNDPPDAAPDRVTTAEDHPVSFHPLSNDFDVDDDSLTLIGLGNPAYGQARSLADGSVAYTPTANYHGSDWLSYVVSDGVYTSTAVVQLGIQPVNDPPQAQDDIYRTGPTVLDLFVLDNDRDLDGDWLVLEAVGPAVGVVGVSDGVIRYRPPEAVAGSERFTYTVSDGRSRDTAWVTVEYGAAAAVQARIQSRSAPQVLRPGSTIAYTVTVQNLGGVVLNRVRLDGTLAPGVSLVNVESWTPGRTRDGTRLAWEIERLALGQRVKMVVQLAITEGIRQGQLVTGTLSSVESGEEFLPMPRHIVDPLLPLDGLTAFRVDPGARITWHSDHQGATRGYHLWRSRGDGSNPLRLNVTLIPITDREAGYSFDDPLALPGVAYRYWVESVKIDGYIQTSPAIPLPIEVQGSSDHRLYLPLVEAIPSLPPARQRPVARWQVYLPQVERATGL